MHWITEPFAADFMLRALVGGVLVSTLCAVVGTWVVVRGMAFLGEAMAHGMLPGVAAATALGIPIVLGAGASAVVMSLGVTFAARQGRLSQDTSIGLLFVWMLGIGVIVISHSGSFATDATAVLFGDVLAITTADLRTLGVALVITFTATVTFHRHFVVLSFDPRVAATLGLRPRLAHVLLVGLVTLAVVSSYRAVGSLLVVGLLLGPAVAARPWSKRLPTGMVLAAAFGGVAVVLGLLVSWYAATAAGASIAVAAIALAVLSGTVRRLVGIARGGPGRATAVAVAGALVLSSCTGGEQRDRADPGSVIGDGHGYVEGAQELPEPPLTLATVDPQGRIELLDLMTEEVRPLGAVRGTTDLTTDGRYLFVSDSDAGEVTVLDTGVWTRDHEDHFHYYRAEPRRIGTVIGDGAATVVTGASRTAIFFPETGATHVLTHDSLAEGELGATALKPAPPHAGLAAPVGRHLLRTLPGSDDTPDRIQVLDAEGTPTSPAGKVCRATRGSILTPVGVVVGCANGALIASEQDGSVVWDVAPYPRRLLREPGVAPARTFHGREGRPTIAALAGSDRIWLLDTRERRWTLISTPTPVVGATAVDDSDEHVLALTRDGRVLVLSARTGRTVGASRRLVTGPTDQPGVVLVADQSRAYLNDPLGKQLFEIDFADAARIARTFTTEHEPSHLAETGR